jgi:hypothetical protein
MFALYCVLLLASETLLEELAMLKKTDVEPADKLRHLNSLTALSSVLFHSSTFSLEDLVPCKVFLKWCELFVLFLLLLLLSVHDFIVVHCACYCGRIWRSTLQIGLLCVIIDLEYIIQSSKLLV